MAYINYPLPESLSLNLEEILKTRRSNVFRMLMHSPALAPSFLTFSDAVRDNNSLPTDLMELAILRVGYTCQAEYQTTRHEGHARVAGLSEAAIEAARSSKEITGIRDIERTVISLTDNILLHDGLSPDGREEALRTLKMVQVSDLVLTVGFYKCVCYFLRSFGVDIEKPA